MNKKSRVRAGELIAVPISFGVVAGLVLHVSKRFKSCCIVGFYDQLFDSHEQIESSSLSGEFINTPNYTSTQVITRSHWIRIGYRPELLEETQIPLLQASYTLYYKDEVVRMLALHELKEYVTLSVQGRGFIEKRLTKHFGLKS